MVVVSLSDDVSGVSIGCLPRALADSAFMEPRGVLAVDGVVVVVVAAAAAAAGGGGGAAVVLVVV